ncbi:MAG: PKD domain-containing protein [Candidatus Pseudobacter hemicellulosilyticus]|uniref:PKD domain-containing protein n=1 Tax=Candidatus Pseudobacter hemicellulosilyticus TaxID=3121375 RepID=A0AAJ5X089_9BACT|nr:MAG: PKD domain-containing protein [Pseudobacter sp.]
MGRKSLIAVLLALATLQLAAQDETSTFEFIENKGQWDGQVKFKGAYASGAFFLRSNGFTVVQQNPADLGRLYERGHKINEPGSEEGGNRQGDIRKGSKTPGNGIVRAHAYQVEFVGANEQASIVPEKPIASNTSYFVGNDPTKWNQGVSTYGAVVYKNVYPNIDVRYYSGYGNLKYDIIVHPGGDPSQVAMRYTGADKISIKNNELIIKTSVGSIRELYPYTYAFNMTTGRQDVDCKYVQTDKNTIKFKVANYDPNSTLVIDPTIVFVSFTGSKANEFGFTATPGPDGSLFSGSIVFGAGFQTTPGAFDQSYNGGAGQGTDVGIFKFSPTGGRVWATYLGGTGNDYPHSLICDPQGNLIVMGRTYSARSFPNTAVEGSLGSADIFVTKLNANGSGIIGSMLIGGSSADCINVEERQGGGGSGANKSTMRFYGDDSRSEVIIDKANNIYIAASTQSVSGSSMFPIKGNVFQPNPGGGQDGVVLKINPDCNTLIWSSFLGGNGDDGAFVLAVHPTTGDLYVAGATLSTNITGTSGVYQTSNQGGADGFIAQITNNGATRLKWTYTGTPDYDAIYGIRFDRYEYPYIMGITQGGNSARPWPHVNAPFYVEKSSQFLAKLRKDLSGFEYSTVFGNGDTRPNLSPVAFMVDRCENVYISGWGGWLEPTGNPFGQGRLVGMPLKDARKGATDDRDFYFIVIERDAADILYGTYFGQDGGEGEHVDGGTSRYDEQGVIYQAICANCFGGRAYPITSRFPTTRGAWAYDNGTGSTGCNLAAVKIEFNFAGVASGPKSFFNGVPDSIGCVPFTVVLRDTVRNAKSYEWDFDGDGVTDLTQPGYETSFTFGAVGIYRVRLIAVDSSSCNIRDTAYINIHVRADKADIGFTATKLGPCTSLTYLFENTSVAPGTKPFSDTSFTWNFGDGSPLVKAGDADQQHTFPASGTYPVELILMDTNYCNAPETIRLSLRIAANVRAQFQTPRAGCVPYEAIFNNTSLGGHDFEWDFGDGGTSTAENPTHTYTSVGTYTVRLRAYDSTTCNKVHDTSFILSVNPRPTAGLSAAPIPPQVNRPTIFTNLSTGGVSYAWDFGDGEVRTKQNSDTVMHQYNEPGTFEVMLVTTNQYGCTDTAHLNVESLIDPLLDVPNAFTPGRFGQNSTIMVKGFGIGTMIWRIYNRSGQKVFETNNRLQGWDGTFKGQLQPMEVYTYTLDVVFTDGRTYRKTGDITLIR